MALGDSREEFQEWLGLAERIETKIAQGCETLEQYETRRINELYLLCDRILCNGGDINIGGHRVGLTIYSDAEVQEAMNRFLEDGAFE